MRPPPRPPRPRESTRPRLTLDLLPAVLPCPARLSQTRAFRVPRLVAAVEVGDARFVSDARSMTSNPRWMQRAELVLAGEDVDEQVARVSVWDKRTSNRKSGENMTCLGAAVFPLARLETFRPTALDLALEGGTRDGARVAIVLELRDAGRETKRENEKTKRAEAKNARAPRVGGDPGARAPGEADAFAPRPRYTTGRQKRETKKNGTHVGPRTVKDVSSNKRARPASPPASPPKSPMTTCAFEVIEPTPREGTRERMRSARARDAAPAPPKDGERDASNDVSNHTPRGGSHADSPPLSSPAPTPRRRARRR